VIRHPHRERVLAVCLSTLAGYVDAIGFLHLGGYFVSFMTGNSTRLGVGLLDDPAQALLPLGLVALFVGGVILGSLVARAANYRRPSRVLALVAVLLLAAAYAAFTGFPAIATALMALAMGAENAVFERDGEVSIGLTYMTGTLVKLGQRITAALLGGDRLAWLWYFMLWLGLVCGAVIGALVFARIGLGGLWPGAGTAAILACIVAIAVEGRGRR
jgi:uncharacterized membrane protein YoaK (UPF0700 family)